MFRFDSDGAGGDDRRRLGAAGRARAAGRDADAAGRRHGGDARLAHGRAGADGQLRGRRGRAGRDDARLRRAGRRRRAGLPRRPPVGRGDRLRRWTPSRSPTDAEQRISYFAELAAQALANAQAREELAASRARIVAAGDAERRRLERNLHDGAQQRLVSLALMLRLAARRHPDDADLDAGGRGAHPRAAGAARAGPRHPPRRADRARARARGPRARRPRAAAGRARGRARRDRLPGPVEAAAYYVVSEALTNVAKYAERHGRPHPRRARRRQRPDRGLRRRRRRREPGRRLRPARPRRPRRGARRPPHDRQPARRRHHPARRDPDLTGLSRRSRWNT